MRQLADSPWPAFFAALVLLAAWRLLAAWDAAVPLSIDEAQYFLWSRELAWGYYSKPPLIAWTIAAATPLCGESELCIRLPALLLLLAASLFVAAIARRRFSAQTAALAGFAFATLFLTSFYSWAMTTDSLLLCCWAAALYFFLRAIERDAWRDWLACGVTVGVGLLAKYTMGLFLLCAFLVLLLDHRPRLLSPKPWLAAVLAMALLIPNLLWNAVHGFATFRHTAEISQLERQLFHPLSLLAFVAAQFGVMGPLLFPAFAIAATRQSIWRNPRLRLFALFSLPVLGLFVLLSFLSRAHANWAAPAYVGATLLAVAWLTEKRLHRWLTPAIVINLLLAAGFYHWHRLAPALGISLSEKTDPFHKLRGWPAAGAALAVHLRATGCGAIAAADRGTLVELAYYARRALAAPVQPLAYNPSGMIRNHFELTANLAHASFACALLVGHFEATRLAKEFATVEPLPPLALPTGISPLWKVAGFIAYDQ